MSTPVPTMPTKHALKANRKAVQRFVRRRLRAECETRGAAAAIAAATGFTTAHIANIKSFDRGPGDDFIHALAAYWGMTYAELESAALDAAEEERATRDSTPPAA